MFSLVWSFGTCLKQDSRKRFEEYLKKLSGRVFPPTSLFDNYYDLEGRNFINWERLVPEYKPPEGNFFFLTFLFFLYLTFKKKVKNI